MGITSNSEHIAITIANFRFKLQARIDLIFDVATFTDSGSGGDIIKVTIKILEKEDNILRLVDREFIGIMRQPTSVDGFIKYIEDRLKKIYEESKVFYLLMIFATDFFEKHGRSIPNFTIVDPITDVVRIDIDDEGKAYQKFFSLTYGEDFNDEDRKNYKIKQLEDFIDEINSSRVSSVVEQPPCKR